MVGTLDGILLTDSELSALRERAIEVASRKGYGGIAKAVEEGCAAGGFQALRELPYESQAIGLSLILDGVPGSETVARRLAAINQISRVADFPPPAFSVGNAPFSFLTRLAAGQALIGERVRATGAGRSLAKVHFLASALVADRINLLGGIKLFEGKPNEVFQALTESLSIFPCLGVIGETLSSMGDLAEAFSLALAGYAPMEHRATGWMVVEVRR
jgi:hypothetical protein